MDRLRFLLAALMLVGAAFVGRQSFEDAIARSPLPTTVPTTSASAPPSAPTDKNKDATVALPPSKTARAKNAGNAVSIKTASREVRRAEKPRRVALAESPATHAATRQGGCRESAPPAARRQLRRPTTQRRDAASIGAGPIARSTGSSTPSPPSPAVQRGADAGGNPSSTGRLLPACECLTPRFETAAGDVFHDARPHRGNFDAGAEAAVGELM